MFRFAIITCLSLAFAGNVLAQAQKLPPDLEGLPDQIKNLKWQTIDFATLTALEQSRALLLLDHVVSELSANVTSEADLMSTYIQKQNLGSAFASTPPPPTPKQLNFGDAEKVAVALLRGPMSASYYATELADVPAAQLASYQQMYQRTCQRKWSEFDEARHQVGCMSSFLGNSQKLQDYDAWATAESALRQKQYDQRSAANPAEPQKAAAQQQSQAQLQALQQQNQQLQQALGAAEYQQQAQTQQTAQAQQQAADAQQQAAQAQQQSYPAGYVAAPAYGVYGGYGAYGASGAYAGAYAGANAANAASAANAANAANAKSANAASAANAANAANAKSANHPTNTQSAAAGAYHANNNTWNRDAGYSSTARSGTEQRMSNFHGASGAREGGGRR